MINNIHNSCGFPADILSFLVGIAYLFVFPINGRFGYTEKYGLVAPGTFDYIYYYVSSSSILSPFLEVPAFL